jgi:hypothetical protein
MSENFKQVTITLPVKKHSEFKKFCKEKEIPFSRFLNISGVFFIENWVSQNSKKCDTLCVGDDNAGK